MDETESATATPQPAAPAEGGADDWGVSEFYRKLNAEWDGLAAQHPVPTLDDIRPEWAWVYGPFMRDLEADPDSPYWNSHVAVYNQKVVGSDTDPTRLRVAVARELGIHPERMVVTYVGEY